MRTGKLLLLFVILVVLSGCTKSIDRETGRTQYNIDPNAAAKFEEGVEKGNIVLAVLSTIWPFLLPVVTGVGGAIKVWKVVKPKLVVAQDEAKMFHSVASSAVLGIEEYKKLYPDNWESLKKELEKLQSKMISPENMIKVENVVRAIRGKPPKA